MVYLPRDMDETHLERQFRNELDLLRIQTNERLQALERPTLATSNNIASPNYLVNSHPEWSKDAWENIDILASTDTDANKECYNWYRQLQTATTLDKASPYPLKRSFTPQHTDWAANEGANDEIPIWDGENGRFLIGNTTTLWDITCPLTTDFIFPGQRYYVYFETIALETGLNLNGAQMYCGFWDNTDGIKNWIEGSPFSPETVIYGPTGTRPLTYKILASTDGGDQLLSQDVVVTNAPTTMTSDNHVRLYFTGAPGFIRFEVYRYDGATYRKVADIKNSIDLQFFDMQENGGTIEPGFPTAINSAPRALKTTISLGAVTDTYTSHTMVIQIPTTYNRSATGNLKQWFRFGLNKTINKARGLAIRRFMVSEGFGPWTRAAADLTQPKSSPTTTASSSPVSGTTSSGEATGGVDCVTLDTLIQVANKSNGVDQSFLIPAKDVTTDHYMVCGGQALPVQHVKEGHVQEIYSIKTVSGFTLNCSATHRVIQSAFDRHGKAVQFLNVGELVLVSKNDQMGQEAIISIEKTAGDTKVRSFSLPAPHRFITGNIVSHNAKRPPFEEPVLI